MDPLFSRNNIVLNNIENISFSTDNSLAVIFDIDCTLGFCFHLMRIADNIDPQIIKVDNDTHVVILKTSEGTIKFIFNFRPKLKEYLIKIRKLCSYMAVFSAGTKYYVHGVTSLIEKLYEIKFDNVFTKDNCLFTIQDNNPLCIKSLTDVVFPLMKQKGMDVHNTKIYMVDDTPSVITETEKQHLYIIPRYIGINSSDNELEKLYEFLYNQKYPYGDLYD